MCRSRSCILALLLVTALPQLTISTALLGGQEQRIWLYSLVAADYDGDRLLSHWLDHYLDLGIKPDHILLDILHDPEASRTGIDNVLGLLQEYQVDYSLLELVYTPELQDRAMVFALASIVGRSDDWVIVADNDEFFTYGLNNIWDLVADMDTQNATFAMGEMLDRVSSNGKLGVVAKEPSIWQQFPLTCPLVANLAEGLPAKVTIFKNFLRPGAGHHHIVEPEWAEEYFGPRCSGRRCEHIMKTYKQRSKQDLLMATPYLRHKHVYKQHAWRAVQYTKWTKVWHFKWHQGVLHNLKARMARDSGDCQIGRNEDACTPNFVFWKEVAKVFESLNTTQALNTTALQCSAEFRDTFWVWN